MGPHTVKFCHMHEPVRIDLLGDYADAGSNRHQTHDLGLYVRRKTRVRKRCNVYRFKLPTGTHAHGAVGPADMRAGFFKLIDQSAQVLEHHVLIGDVAARNRAAIINVPASILSG